MTSKKWLSIFSISIFFIITIVAIFNWKIDSLGLVNKNSFLNNAAKELANGNLIAGLKNYDERIFIKKVIEHLEKPDWVVIGSSRAMQIRKNMFLSKNKNFFNYSVSGASIEDYLAILQTHYNRFNEFPQNIIIGIDPWIFNKNNGQTRYLSLKEEYTQFLKTLDIKNNTSIQNQNKLLKLFSFEYLKENLKFLKNISKRNMQAFYIAKDLNIDDQIRGKDGSIYYSYKNRFPDSKVVEKQAIKYASGNVYSLERFNKLSNKITFEKLIQYLINNNSNIYFYLHPYNPISYDIIISKEKYHLLNKAEEYIHILSKSNNIKVIGSYNPHLYKLKSNDFFDGMHSLDNVYSNILNDLTIKK